MADAIWNVTDAVWNWMQAERAKAPPNVFVDFGRAMAIAMLLVFLLVAGSIERFMLMLPGAHRANARAHSE